MNNKSIIENGTNYMKLGDNKYIQWGYNNDYTQGNKTVTFPKPFTAVPVVTCGRVNTHTSSTGGRATNIYSIPTKTNFVYYVYNQEEGGYFMWHAIGK